jgi:hypothetical protein
VGSTMAVGANRGAEAEGTPEESKTYTTKSETSNNNMAGALVELAALLFPGLSNRTSEW